MLIGLDGHIKLTDFGLSRYYYLSNQRQIKKGTPIQDLRSYSYCGTEQYMAVWSIIHSLHSRKCWWENPIQKLLIGGHWEYYYVNVSQAVILSKAIHIEYDGYWMILILANTCEYYKSFIHTTSSRNLNGCSISNPSIT